MASTSDLRLPLEQACTHTRARAHTRTHTVRADQERSLPKHVCALHCTHDRQRASLAATSYNLLPLNLPPLRCRAALHPPATAAEGLRTSSPPVARPEHRTLGSHVSTPGQEGHIGAMGEGGEPGAALRHFGASAAVRLLNLDRRSPARQVRRVGREGWGDGQVGEVSEGRAALAPVAAPVGGCECRESCCSCTPVHRVDPRTPLTYTPYRRRQLRPELEIRPRSLEIFPSSHATDLPCLAG